jgi:O-antigen/teichoic acid export membrane protein
MVALLMHATYGFGGAIVLALASAAISRTFFGASVMATPELSLVYAIAFFAVNVSTPFLRNILIPMGGVRTVLVATLVSLAVGLPISVFLARPVGAVGVAAGLAASEVLMAALVVLASVNRERRTR